VAIHAWRQPGALPFDARETLIVEALLRGTTMGWLPRLLALPVFAAALWGLAHYPFANDVALGAGLAAYAALGLWRPTLMLFLTPPWLALINLAHGAAACIWKTTTCSWPQRWACSWSGVSTPPAFA
jgi:hypothetical protein